MMLLMAKIKMGSLHTGLFYFCCKEPVQYMCVIVYCFV